MKTRIYSLLFAIHLLYAFGTLLPVNSLPGGSIIDPPSTDTEEVPASPDSLPGLPSTCLVTSLSSSSQLLMRTGMLACLNGEKLDDDNYEAMYTALKQTLTSSLCTVDTVLKTGDTLKQLGTPTSKVVKTLVSSLRPILEKSGLSKPVFGTLCSLLQPAFTPSCVPAILGVDTVKLIVDMKLETCKGQKEFLWYQEVASILKRLNCILKSPKDLQVPAVIEPDLNPELLDTKAVIEPDLNTELLDAKVPDPDVMPEILPPLPDLEPELPETLPSTPVLEPELPEHLPSSVPDTDVLPELLPPLPDLQPEPFLETLSSTPDLGPELLAGPFPLPESEPELLTASLPSPKPDFIGNHPILLFKRDLGEAQLPQKGPNDPVVLVACKAVDLLLESVTPV